MSATENQTTLATAQRVVLAYFGFSDRDFHRHRSSRRQAWVWARWILCRLISNHTDLSSVQIGELLDIDSSSVRFGLLKFSDEIAQNPNRRRDWQNCLDKFLSECGYPSARDGGNLHSGFKLARVLE